MATALRQFSTAQFGREATKGTAVPATRLVVGEWNIAEEQDFYRSDYPAGVRAPTGGAGIVTRAGTVLDGETDLTAEEILWPLLTGIEGQVTPTAAGGEQTWVFDPTILEGQVIDSATIEYAHSDGATVHYYAEAAYALCEEFGFAWTFNEVATMTAKWFARERADGTKTPGLTPYADREPLVSNLLEISLDDAWAELGTTQLHCLVRSVSAKFITGLRPDYTISGRRDFCDHAIGSLSGTLDMELEMDATGAALFEHYRDNDLVFIRLHNPGGVLTTNPRYVQVDGCWRFAGPPEFSTSDDQVLMSMSFELAYDQVSGKAAVFEVLNAIAAAGL